MGTRSVVQTTCKGVGRLWGITRTFVLWKPRLCGLGCRTVLSSALHCNNPAAVLIGNHVSLLDQFILADLKVGSGRYPKIIIGDGCTIMYRFQCNAAELVRIGRNVLIASNVLITDSDHVIEPEGVPVTRSQKLATNPVVVEDNCWIGQNAMILKGVVIGHDSIIGAGSVVTHDVPPLSIAAGNPARIIGSVDQEKDMEGLMGSASDREGAAPVL